MITRGNTSKFVNFFSQKLFDLGRKFLHEIITQHKRIHTPSKLKQVSLKFMMVSVRLNFYWNTTTLS